MQENERDLARMDGLPKSDQKSELPRNATSPFGGLLEQIEHLPCIQHGCQRPGSPGFFEATPLVRLIDVRAIFNKERLGVAACTSCSYRRNFWRRHLRTLSNYSSRKWWLC